MIAEARCMRAWAYANLFWMFGHWWEADDCAYGILYRDQMSNLSNLQVPRITVGESYQKIFEDLEPGLKYLPDFTTPRYLSKQLAQVLKAKLLLNRGVMRGDVQDLKDALDLVLTVKKDAPGSWKMEADLAEMYEKGWESGEVLWTRYMGDITNCAWSEFTYSYAIGYNNTYSGSGNLGYKKCLGIKETVSRRTERYSRCSLYGLLFPLCRTLSDGSRIESPAGRLFRCRCFGSAE